MYALVAETGALLWKTKLGDRIESSACVSLCGKYIIVGKEKLQSQTGTFIYTCTCITWKPCKGRKEMAGGKEST